MMLRPLALLTLCYTLCGSAAAQGNMPMPPMKDGGGYSGELPQFDVISVKPHKPGDDLMFIHWGQTDYKTVNLTLKSMIANVYGVRPWLVFGLPPWAESTHWDIDAKVSAPDLSVMEKLSPAQRQQMIGGILKDRFGLVVHQETKVQPVFVMTVLPDSAKLKESPPLPAGSDDPKKLTAGTWHIGRGMLSATRMKMATLADNLSGPVERNILDRTGLTGVYDINLKWTPQDRSNAGTDNGTAVDTPPAIFEALKEQLGLKLTADKAPVPTIVIDRIMQPEAD